MEMQNKVQKELNNLDSEQKDSILENFFINDPKFCS